jgi:hypothetical protein
MQSLENRRQDIENLLIVAYKLKAALEERLLVANDPIERERHELEMRKRDEQIIRWESELANLGNGLGNLLLPTPAGSEKYENSGEADNSITNPLIFEFLSATNSVYQQISKQLDDEIKILQKRIVELEARFKESSNITTTTALVREDIPQQDVESKPAPKKVSNRLPSVQTWKVPRWVLALILGVILTVLVIMVPLGAMGQPNPTLTPSTATINITASSTPTPIAPQTVSNTTDKPLVILRVGTSRRGDTIIAEPGDVATEFTQGQDVFAYLHCDKARVNQDKVEVTLIFNAIPQPSIPYTLTKESGFSFIPLTNLTAGNYKLEVRYNGNVMANQPEFKVLPSNAYPELTGTPTPTPATSPTVVSTIVAPTPTVINTVAPTNTIAPTLAPSPTPITPSPTPIIIPSPTPIAPLPEPTCTTETS